MIYYLKAGATDNERGLPTEWPVKMKKSEDGEEMALPWILATEEEYEAHKKQYEQEYKAWKAQRDALEKAAVEKQKKEKSDKLLSAKQKLGELGFDEEEIRYIIGKLHEK